MAKTANVSAKDLFKNSVLFKAKVVSDNPNAGGKTATAKYDLECRKCGDKVDGRRGNSTAIFKCLNCKRTWDPVTNTIIEPVTEVVEKLTHPVQTIDSESDDEESESIKAKLVQTQNKKPGPNVGDIINVLKGVSKEVSKPKIEIIDYYDERVDGKWHRLYYTKPKMEFIIDVEIDKKISKDYETKLKKIEHFSIMYPNPKAVMKKHAHRTKMDVLRENRETDNEFVEEVEVEKPVDEVEKPVVVEKTVKYVQLKVGQSFYTPDGYLVECVE
jgi:ribosomal protein L37AE/L43A